MSELDGLKNNVRRESWLAFLLGPSVQPKKRGLKVANVKQEQRSWSLRWPERKPVFQSILLLLVDSLMMSWRGPWNPDHVSPQVQVNSRPWGLPGLLQMCQDVAWKVKSSGEGLTYPEGYPFFQWPHCRVRTWLCSSHGVRKSFCPVAQIATVKTITGQVRVEALGRFSVGLEKPGFDIWL